MSTKKTETPRPPIRVAFCHYSSDVFGGSDRSLFDLVTHLPKERFTALMILKTGDPLAAQYREAGIEVAEFTFVPPRKALDPVKLFNFFFSFLPTTLRVRAALRRFKAEVVCVNTLFNIQCATAAYLARRPLVWYVRELSLNSRLFDLMLSLTPRLATQTLAASNAVAAAIDRFGKPAQVVFDPVDLAEYPGESEGEEVREEFDLSPEQPLIVTIGRLEHWKGQHVFIEAAPEVLKSYPDARFLIVGGEAVNKPEYAEGLRAQCAQLGLEDRVVFTGIRKDVPRILYASTVLILPSVTPEPFGRTVVEAMAASRPVIATRAGGPLDSVLDGETGILVEPGNAADLAQAIKRLLEQPDQACEMGRKGRQRAIELFSLDYYVESIGAVLERQVRR